MDVGRDTFAPYTGDLGNLRPEGMPSPFSLLFLPFYLLFVCLTFTYCFTALGRPSLSKFHRNRVHRAHLFVDRNFHSLVTLQCLAKWGLGPEPSTEAIAHEVTVRRRKFLLAQILYVIFFGLNLIFIYNYLSGMATMKENKGKEVVEGEGHPKTQSQARPSAGDKRKSLSKNLDLGNLPSRPGKKANHGLSKTETVQANPPTPPPSDQIFDVDSSTPMDVILSKTALVWRS